VGGYQPDIDISDALGPDRASYYQTMIGVMRWMVEIGRVNIATEFSLFSSHLAYPPEGHFEFALHMMSYLKWKHNSCLVFDTIHPEIDFDTFNDGAEWREFYDNVTEVIPFKSPNPRRKPVDINNLIHMWVDSDHAGDKDTRRLRTGYFIFMNTALIAWLSKKQVTIEGSVFGAEFVAMKICVETLRGLRYKLCMMGVPITGPTFVYGDSMSIIYNTSRPELTLKKKSNPSC